MIFGRRYKWWVVGMLWFVCFFNYADRQAIFSVFPLLKTEMGLSDFQLGIVGASFMWVYALGAPLAARGGIGLPLAAQPAGRPEVFAAPPLARYLQDGREGAMYIPSGVVKQAKIARGVAAVERELAPDVVHIRYEITPDWGDEWAIFFRILLSDEASREERLAEVASRARSRLADKLKLDESGLLAYFNFRSQSEQKTLKEPAWA
jgi:hypothetical protein